MTITQFVKIVQRNLIILGAIPVIMAVLVWFFSRNESKTYTSETSIYTGIASGSSIVSQESQNVDFFGVKVVFDNLLTVIQSRETMEQTAIQLLAQNLSLSKPDPNYISKAHFDELNKKVPKNIKSLIIKDDLALSIKNLQDYKRLNDSNFVYKLLNLDDKHYSIKAISQIKVERKDNSDIVKIRYSNDDAGITQQTLIILTKVFISKYKRIKENQSMDVVKYFEEQVTGAAEKLKGAEDRLLEFNQQNNIINYYEQSKYIAAQKEELDVKIQETNMDLVAAEAAVKELESKLGNKNQIMLRTNNIVKLRNNLSKVSSEIAVIQTSQGDSSKSKNLIKLQKTFDNLKDQLKTEVNSLQAINETSEGVPVKQILGDWLKNVVLLEESKARMGILQQRKKEFEIVYQKFAPLGATLKRIEREISVAEQAYLGLLNSLSLAKLKQQNIEMSSNIDVIDEPYYPIEPEASKRKILILAAFVLGFIFTLAIVLVLEYLDTNIRNPEKAQKITGLRLAGVFPVLRKYSKSIDFDFVKNRSIEVAVQSIKLKLEDKNDTKVLLVFSTLEREGKTLLIEKIAEKLTEYGLKVVVLSTDEIQENTEYPYQRIKFEMPSNFFEYRHLEEISSQNYPEFDYVLLELPSILHHNYPVSLMQKVDLSLLVCRANRTWTKADTNALTVFKKHNINKMEVILNGAELYNIESVFGEIPRKRSKIRILLKRILTLQFKSSAKF